MKERNTTWQSRGWLLLLPVLAGACRGGGVELPHPRPIVVHSGARIRADYERMKEINTWVNREQKNIVEDPTFLVSVEPMPRETYPWEGMEIVADTVHLKIERGAADATLAYQIYGHLHLMVKMGRQEEWLPEAPTATGYELERAILARVSDAWLLGRAVFDTTPYPPLDEIMFANEFGYLDAMIFTARPDEFGDARKAWVQENPDGIEKYRSWFVATFEREPPGLRRKAEPNPRRFLGGTALRDRGAPDQASVTSQRADTGS